MRGFLIFKLILHLDSLFQHTEDEHPLTVSELNAFIKQSLETQLRDIYVIGEISGYKRAQPSGHSYFSIKDEKSQVSCNLWSFRHANLKFPLKDGKKVLIRGRITVYEPRGSYAIEVNTITEIGIGELQAAFERLKEKLKSEGLFDDVNKKSIPEFPENVAIITSETGAVIEDFIKVSRKRYPHFNLYLFPSLVQGKGSIESICRAIRKANDYSIKFDVIVIARGGGSIEDLWTFNEEAVARAVFQSEIPIVSAIGHEVDYTICDFVADLRAPTPSAAAEMILPDRRELINILDDNESGLESVVKDRLNYLKDQLNRIKNNYSFNKPRDILNDMKIKLDDISDDFRKILTDNINFYNNDIEEKQKSLVNVCDSRISYIKNDLNYKEKLLNNISPDNTLKRGFSFVQMNGNIVSKKSGLKKNDKINIKFHDGDVNAVVD
jgi:exodeoxyribonuclease VII large subunit